MKTHGTIDHPLFGPIRWYGRDPTQSYLPTISSTVATAKCQLSEQLFQMKVDVVDLVQKTSAGTNGL